MSKLEEASETARTAGRLVSKRKRGIPKGKLGPKRLDGKRRQTRSRTAQV